jgi:hypothetical protein
MNNIHVFAIRILAISMRLGQLVPMDLSRMKPMSSQTLSNNLEKKNSTGLRQDMNLSAFRRLF